MTPTTIAVGILALAALGVLTFLFLSATRGRRAAENVPPSMRPGYSDEQLERGVLERYMAWGVVLTLFFAVFFPLYWLRESHRLAQETEAFYVSAVVRGEEEYRQLCAECHGPQAQGGAAPNPPGYGEGAWPAPALNNIVRRYEDNPAVFDIRDMIVTVTERGRPGTPMPAWGAAYGGPLTDQQINDIVEWILANQVDEVAEADPAVDLSGEELYQENCMRCHGENLEGLIAPTLVGVFERHSDEAILNILRNGVLVTAAGPSMPPWQNGYQTQPLTDDALERVIEYLRERQPDEIPDELRRWQTPPGRTPADVEDVDPGDVDAVAADEDDEPARTSDRGREEDRPA